MQLELNDLSMIKQLKQSGEFGFIFWKLNLKTKQIYCASDWAPFFNLKEEKNFNFIQLSELILQDDRAGYLKKYNAILEKKIAEQSIIYRIRNKLNLDAWYEDIIIYNEKLEPDMVSIITKKVRTSVINYIHHSINDFYFNNLFDSLPAEIYWKDLKGRYIGANSKFVKAWGLKDKSELLGKTREEAFADTNPIVQVFFDDKIVLERGEEVSYQKLHFDPPINGKEWGAFTKTPFYDPFGQICGLVGIFYDITQYVKTEMQLAKTIEDLELVVDTAKIALIEVDLAKSNVNIKMGASYLLGDNYLKTVSLDILLNRIHPDDVKQTYKKIVEHIENKTEYFRCEIRFTSVFNEWLWLVFQGKVTSLDKDNRPLALCGVFFDITYRKKIEEKIKFASEHDALTGSLNRFLFEKDFSEFFVQKQNRDTQSLAILDIDFFKKFNDDYGHHQGDKALSLVARISENVINLYGKVYRIGGEEFGILCEDLTQVELEKLLEKLRFEIENYDLSIVDPCFKNRKMTVSIGASMFNGYTNKKEVFVRADDALYFAKSNGRNQIKMNH